MLDNLKARTVTETIIDIPLEHEVLPHEEVMVPPPPTASTSPVMPSTEPEQTGPELKPISRAEDVARRAQEFLRRVAMGRAAASDGAIPPPKPSEPWGQSSGSTVEPTPAPTENGRSTGKTVLQLVEPVKPTTVNPTAQRVLGIRETNQGVLFVQPLTLGDRLAIAANFNNWSGTSHPMRANYELGVWELCIKLPPGKLLYRLVIDGHWCTDPYNDTCEPNPFGETNSAFVIETGVGFPSPAGVF